MQLQSQDLEELADFFATRFPSAGDRDALVRSTGLETVLPSEPIPAWLVLLATAQQKDRLGVLVQAAAGLRPEDDTLADVAETFAEERKMPIGKALISLAVLLALGAGAAAWFATSERHIDGRSPETEPAAVTAAQTLAAQTLAAQTLAAQTPAAQTPTPEQAGTAPTGAAQGASQESAPAQAEAQPPAQVPIDETQPQRTGAWVEGRCGGPAGRLVGYWYAGFPFEPRQGHVYTLQHGKNVRAAYPARENDWDAREPVTCVLREGDRVKLSAAPVLVDGGKYWVPLHSGDLLF